MDKVKVIRIVVYEGDRKWVEETVRKSIHGDHIVSEGRKITAVTLGDFPEILEEKILEEVNKNVEDS